MMTGSNVLPTKILVKKFEKPNRVTKTGILILKDVDKDPNITGDVILTGEGTDQVKMVVKAGQRVLFNPHSFQRVRIEETEYLLVDVRDVLFYYTPEK
jgi:chaperonin GroES